MGSSDGTDDRDARRCEQDDVRQRETPQKRSWVARREGGEMRVSERLDNEDDRHEQRPDENHGVHPPERGVREIHKPVAPASGIDQRT